MSTITPSASLGGATIFGHKPPLFVLFFTEMWERFSYYGMRVLLVVFLVTVAFDDQWSRADALALYGIYTGFVYFTPMIGGILADKVLGYRRAVALGALIMTLGHASMALETENFFYLGLLLLIIGNGLFKPNISSIVGQLYTDTPELKDGAYTIFYMGINAGAFLGIGLCSYYGEQISFSLGFGLAGIFMFVGLLQFWFSQDIFGRIGLPPSHPDYLDPAVTPGESAVATHYEDQVVDDGLASGGRSVVMDTPDDGPRAVRWGAIGLVLGGLLYALISVFGEEQANALQTFSRELMPPIILAAVVGFIGWIVSDKGLSKVERDRVWVIVILSFFIVFFWWAFEQAGGSMTIFALDYTDRSLTGEGAVWFRWVNAALNIVPMLVLTWVLAKLFSVTFSRFSLANILLGLGFLGVWGLIGYMLYQQFSADSNEVPAGWFQIFNSLFIICLAPAFSRLWEKNIPALRSGPIKFALGLTLLGVGFAILAFGAMGIPEGAKTASVSMFWLIAAYLFHTLGELCISPVGLSYVSKLAPLRLVGLMFGVFFVANFIANFAGGLTGSYIEPIAEEIGLSGFFLIFAAVPIAAAVVLVIINPWMKRMMHGIE